MLETTLIYGITFAMSLFFCKMYEKLNENSSNIKKVLIMLGIVFPPILISTIRWGVGTDFFEYLHYYDIIRSNFSISFIWQFFSKEPLYVIFTYLGHLLHGAIGINFVFACLYIFFMLKGILYFKEKISITLSLFIMYFSQYLISFNILRQMIAVSIIFYAIRYVFEKKIYKYIFWVIIAGMFHKTAYVMIFLYLLNFKLDSKKVNKIFYTLIAISPILMLPVQKIIVYLTNKLMIFEKYTNTAVDFDLKFLLYVLPILILVAIKRKRILELDEKYELLIRILFLQIPFQFLGCFVNIADRMAIYCAAFQIILISLILKTNMIKIEKRILDNKKTLKISDIKYNVITIFSKIMNNKQIVGFGIVFWYVLYFIVIYVVLKGQGVYPYQSIFDKFAI